MAGALIGALRVSLGLDSAQFSAGLKNAQTRLSGFGKAAAVGLKAVAVASAVAGAALGVAVKNAVDHADELSKTSQKIGVSVEALSRLEYAAKLSDVSLEGLSTGLRKLSQNMASMAAGQKGGPAAAFQALGVAVTDAQGRLRDSDAVLADVADRFSRMEDGATKTALAVQLFGKSGADLIPLLNQGRDGLAAMASESDKLGATISSSSAAAAEEFNDTLTRVGATMQGVANKVMEAALPAMQGLADTLASPEFASAAAILAENIVGALNVVLQTIASIINGIKSIGDWMEGPGAKAPEGAGLRHLYPSAYGKAEGDLYKQLEAMGMHGSSEWTNGLYEGFSFGADGTIKLRQTVKDLTVDLGGAKKELIDLSANAGKFTDSAIEMASAVGDSLGGAFSRLADAVMSGNDALSATVDVLMDLGKQLVTGAINSFFGNLFTGGLFGGSGLGAGAIGRGVYGGSGGFFPGFPGLASGTDNWRGGMTWVGERGPELLNLPRGSQVIPNHDLGNLGGRSEVLVRLSPGLEAQILQKAAGQSIDIATQVVQTQAPAATAKARRNKVGG